MKAAPLNALTAHWASTHRAGSTVMSGLGIWPLLAFLAAGAGPKERAELEDALGLPADTAVETARTVLAVLNDSPAIHTALGLWTRDELPLRPAWAGLLPDGAHGGLTGKPDVDQRTLDAWASRQTGGLIPSMPVTVDEGTLLVLASALSVRTTWLKPFKEDLGGFEDTLVHTLVRRTPLLDRARVAETPDGRLTMLPVMGSGGIDVHLALGEEKRRPGDVIAAAIRTLDRRYPVTTADRLPSGSPGPGLTIAAARSYEPESFFRVTLPSFTVHAEHDLLALPGLFGLAEARRSPGDHFPGVSPKPLVIDQARQNAMASFQAKGFESAAVTAVAAAAGAAAETPPYRIKRIDLNFDRPFAALAVHRRTGLVLTATWVADATPYEWD